MSVSSLIEEHWLPAQEARNLKPSTLALYRRAAAAWIVPHIGERDAADVTPADVRRLVEILRTTPTSMGRAGLSARSLQLSVGLLKSAYAFAVESALLERNPIAVVRRPRVDERSPTTWGVPDARRFLVSLGADPLVAMWALLLTRGLRRGEAAGLRWSEVDLDEGCIRVLHTLVVIDGRVCESTPKTKQGRRTVPLDAHLVSLLCERRRIQDADRARGGSAWKETGYVFTNRFGDRLSPDWVSRRFRKLSAAAGVPPIRVHDSRHTAASIMLASGVHAKVVQEMLGHSHVDITLGIYGHVTPTMGREAGESLTAKLLGPA
jgi:integrase